ncbi:MAG: helix-turn-helix domain-containing protein [Bacteroidales bacterium]|nr:helix-turn-helix domain-containing protein [Bacteroidales bacterium]
MKNPELDRAFEYVQYTNRNIFLTGKAGTGKTTFLRSLKSRLQKRLVVVAPTGVAAINAGGQTIHSFFQLPFGPIVSERVAGHKVDNPNFKQKFAKKKINIIKSLDLLIIDEISMVRADVLDAIDDVLRRYKNRALPFGGVQLLMIGDLQQLAPVVKDNEWAMMRQYYQSMFFFNSYALKEMPMVSLELRHVYRQSDGVFLDILNEIRDDKLSQKSYDLLHERYLPNFVPKEKEGYITLTTHNNSADKTNNIHLEKLKTKSKSFMASVKGNFSEYSYPTDFELELKVGSQVMFVKNDSSMDKRYFNGKIGVITAFEEDDIVVKCDGDDEKIYANPEVWENIKYSINDQTKEISEEFVGSFTQYPLRLAWAITIHKSQGLTFDKAIIDAAAAFAHGQTYVALSRCRTLEGLVLSSEISNSAIICDREVQGFNKKVEENQPSEENLKEAKYIYQFDLIQDLFNFKQLAYWFQRLEKALWEHKRSVQGNLHTTVTEIQKSVVPELSKVSMGFLSQVKGILVENPNAEENEHLQERIKKASEYFYKFQEEKIVKELSNSSFDTDNKESRKAIELALDHIMEILNVKQKSFQICRFGFRVHDYLEVRAKASIDSTEKKKKAKSEFREVDTVHPELYKLLKSWRYSESEERGVPPFQVGTNIMLQGIVNGLPTNEKQLKKVKGVGKVTMKMYATEILEIVGQYMDEKDIVHSPIKKVIKEEAKKKKEAKVPSYEKSYKLYLAGKEVEEIAELMGFVKSTIENHLSRYVATGNLDVDEFVDKNVVGKIMKYYKQNPEAQTGEVKNHFGEDVGYAEIRMVQKHLEFLGS